MRLFRTVAVLNGLMMLYLGVLGLVAPLGAMHLMAAGADVPDYPSLYPLMRMHTATDLGLGVGFLLVAWRPLQSFAAMMLCIGANLAHGLVHVLELGQGNYARDHFVAITGLVILSLILAVLYPWKEAANRFFTGPAY